LHIGKEGQPIGKGGLGIGKEAVRIEEKSGGASGRAGKQYWDVQGDPTGGGDPRRGV